MRYHPISLNVVRQALKLSALPQPRKMRKNNQEVTPTGKIVTHYILEYAWTQIMTPGLIIPGDEPSYEDAILERLDAAFCSDIATVSLGFNTPRDPVFIGIVTIFDPYDRSECNG